MEKEKQDCGRIGEVIESLRPHLQKDGGDLEFVRYEEATNVLEVRYLGNCRDCPLAIMTLRAGIERVILKELPFVRRVEAVR